MSTQTLQKWNKVKLGDVAEIESGGTPSSTKSEYWDGGDICWATLPDLENKYLFDTQRKITSLGLKNSSAKLLPINSVIFSSRATIGEVAITKVETSTNQGSKNFICDPTKIDYEFLYYLLKSKVEEIYNLASGATYKEINKTVFSAVEIEIPNIPIQKQIAQVLAVYDDLIYNNSRRIKILEQIAQAIYQDTFDSLTGKSVSLGEAITIHRGKSYGSHELSVTDGIPFVNLKCIDRDGGFRKSGLKRFTGNYKDTHKVVSGDIVMAVTDMTQDRRIVARAARVPTLEGGFGVISMDLVKIEPREGNDKDYIYSLLRWSGFADEVKNHANGANVLHLIPDRITDYKTAIASPKKQKEFGDAVNPLLDLIDKLELQNESLRQSRDLLLPKLVTGEIKI